MRRETEEQRIVSRRRAALEDDEEIEAALAGALGTLPRGGYYSTPIPVIGTKGAVGWDAYELVLTTMRLLAFPRPSNAPAPWIECDRSSAHVIVVRKLGPWTWISAVFHDREVRMLVSRGFREPLARMTQALP
jgi:hypothetical protein